MRRITWALFVFLFLTATPGGAQLTGAAEGPVAMGHHHLNVSDLAAAKRFWVDLLGGEPLKLGRLEGAKYPNAIVLFRQREPAAGTIGSTVNHIGFLTPDLRASVDKLKAAGVPIVTKREISGGRAKGDIYYVESVKTSIAYAMSPSGVKVELVEDTSLSKPIANHHIHFYTPDVAAIKAWYVERFGAKPGKRGDFEAADLPGVNLTFSKAAEKFAGTKGRALDHIGFEVDQLEAFCKKLEADGVKFDVPFREVPALKLKIAFLTDPWGTYIELTEGLDKL